MSDTILIDSPQEFAARAVPLLKEYLKKVLAIGNSLRELRKKYEATDAESKNEIYNILMIEWHALRVYFDRLRPAISEFSQQVSGMIDQGRVTPLMRAELQLRLAELESAVLQIPELFQAYMPRAA